MRWRPRSSGVSPAAGAAMIDLSGKRLLVTRAAEDAPEWAREIARAGGRPVILPCVVVERLTDRDTAAALRGALRGAAWLALASRRGAEAAADLVGGELPPSVKIAAVGPSTAAAARRRFGRCDLVPPEATGRGLAIALRQALSASREKAPVVVAAADRGRREIEEILAPEGVEVRRVAVYRSRPAPPASPRRRLGRDELDAVLLASPSAVRGLLNQAEVDARLPLVTIGPTTSEAVRHAGLRVAAEARRPGIHGLLEVVP
ncbi:MAG: uroporphyrinogen-III synthase [Acidobacteria bacterium]|nr:MAG: uroporphyrinogen-III synthase [Acidobacteriota bacterium]